MAIITEEIDENRPSKPTRETPKPTHKTPKPPPTSTSPNPFSFWFYFTLSVSLATFLFSSLPSLSSQDPKSWFLSLPTNLRHHYSKGRIIKVQTDAHHPPFEVFTVQEGAKASENVVIVHGLGSSSYAFRNVIQFLGSRGVHAVGVDLPGSGFSDKSVLVEEMGDGGVLGRFSEVYSLIQEKGFFWAFDHLVETGQMPYEEIQIQVSKRKSVKVLELGPEEMGIYANWVSENSGVVRSVTLVDTMLGASALPLWPLGVPVVREVVLGFEFVFARLLNLCCVRKIPISDVEAHRVLLKGRDGARAVVGTGKKLNSSFDLQEWGDSEGLKGLPVQVLWSSGWSKEWSEGGRKVADALPHATFITHSGSRWPQEDAADELAENILRFVSSLPKSVRQVEEEPVPEHIQRCSMKHKAGDHHSPSPSP
ncbi:Protein auxin response 4 [Vitis vinifera]|uniref:Protein auxin response 4 n=1 Tax=Vitis vinifera TaxID=29760 RepID=A0A438KCK5_VITVI|nr:Protein auxin response 4 [Vitis vinifera]